MESLGGSSEQVRQSGIQIGVFQSVEIFVAFLGRSWGNECKAVVCA